MIRIEHLSKTFRIGESGEVKALEDINFELNDGEYAVLMGTNGSGKSTLLNLIAGTLSPDEGHISLDSISLLDKQEHERSPFIARLFQNPLSGTAPGLSILENFRLAALRSGPKKLRIGTGGIFRSRVADSICRLGMGLENRLDQKMGLLSGGQRQALTLLMGTMDECRILLMDEPSSALDPRSSEMIMNLADSIIAEKKLTALLITHSIRDGLRYGSRMLLMKDGKIAEDIPQEKKKLLQAGYLYQWFG